MKGQIRMSIYRKGFGTKTAFLVLTILLLIIFPFNIQAKETRGTPQLTSLEAAKMAYQEACKWDSEAVLWYMNPPAVTLDYHWGENDLAWEWIFIFARPQDEQVHYIKIKDSKIISTEEGGEYLKRKSPILPDFPKDRPRISMREAAQVAFSAGAPSWERPSIVYIIENSNKEFQGRPVWFFLFGSKLSTYVIDGITGEFLAQEYFDPETLKKISPEEVKYDFDPDKVAKIKEENFIYDFFEAMDQGDTELYFSMMDKELLGNENMQGMWKTTFSSLELIKVVSVYPEEKRKWHNNQPLYRVIVYALSKPGFPYYGWDEGRNTRWISISPEGNSWKITAIATSP
jgi:hypothetical protein